MGILKKLFGKKYCHQDLPGVNLRAKALSTPANKLGFSPDDDFPLAYGVLTDWDIEGVTATVMSMRDGTASLYTTSTFSIIGGHAHDNVRAAAGQYFKLAEQFIENGKSVNEFTYPKSGQVYFYILAYDGVRRCVGNEDDIENGSDLTYPLFAAAQDVLTNLRLVTEKESV